jgi:death-on-curing protein
MKHLTAEEVLVIHSELIDQTGGLHGVRDIDLLISAVERPKAKFDGKELYKGVFEKAAAYFESFARHHIFTDGNKRTALVASARFLFLNGYELVASDRAAEEFTLKVAVKKLGVKAVAAWLKRNSRKLK